MAYTINQDPKLINALKDAVEELKGINETLKSMDKKLKAIANYYANSIEGDGDMITMITVVEEADDNESVD